MSRERSGTAREVYFPLQGRQLEQMRRKFARLLEAIDTAVEHERASGREVHSILIDSNSGLW